MASDITLAVGDGSSRMTYAQLAEARNIPLPAARRLTLRHHWHKQVGNDGVVIVSVPLSALQNPEKPMTFRDPGTRRRGVSWDDAGSDTGRDGGADIVRDPAVRALEHAVEALCAQLHRSEQWVPALRAELAEAQATERKAVELVKYITAEASELRQRADDALTAERIARDEAAGLRAEFDARRQWGLRRRLRWALSRKR
jgi:hypothetical protein